MRSPFWYEMRRYEVLEELRDNLVNESVLFMVGGVESGVGRAGEALPWSKRFHEMLFCDLTSGNKVELNICTEK